MSTLRTATTVVVHCQNGRIVDSTITVVSTAGFIASGTAVLLDTDGRRNMFSYTGLTATTFTGVSHLESGQPHYRLNDYPANSTVAGGGGDGTKVLTATDGTQYQLIVTSDGRLEVWPVI